MPYRLIVLLLTIILLIGVMPVFLILGDPSHDFMLPPDNKTNEFDGDDFIPYEVLAPADSLNHAREIAAAYKLSLKSYAQGVAVFNTQDPDLSVSQSESIKAQGIQAFSHIPLLSYNWIYTMDKTTEEINTYTVSYTANQWHHDEMETLPAWDITKGEGVVVAIIDSGIDLNHTAFNGRISEKSYNAYTNQVGLAYVQDDVGHGTSVSGVLAAAPVCDENVFGIAPEAEIIAIKTNDAGKESVESAALYRAINYAVDNGADIINLSMGRPYYYGPDSLEQETIANAVANNVTVICSAGNESRNTVGYPAAYPEAIAVSALKQGAVFDNGYSNYGHAIDISAPGTDIYTTSNGGGYVSKTGTSYAAPNVAGVAALIKSINPGYTPAQVRQDLYNTAKYSGNLPGRNVYYGYGMAHPYAAVLGMDVLYSVTFHYNDNLWMTRVINVIPGSKVKMPDVSQFINNIISFWAFNTNDGNAFDFSTPVNSNITLYAQWTPILPSMYLNQFPDVNFCREVLRLLNEKDDGKRTISSILDATDMAILASFERLDIPDMQINNIKGLDYFTGIISLECGGNQLMALDIHQNTALEILKCDNNRLSTLDVSNNNKLKTLSCFNNQLTVLDVSNNTALEVLKCDSNQLTVLDVSNNTALEILKCDGNQLTMLDMSNNIALKTLSCFNNQLTKLDISNNIVMETLNCNNNKITALDISHNPLIVNLYCEDNILTALDVSFNPNLSRLECRNNFIGSVNDVSGWQTKPKLIFNETFHFDPQHDGIRPEGKDITNAFTDVNFLAAVREIIKKPNGSIIDYDVAKIVTLNVRSRNIKNLEGIEYFPLLMVLDCSNNLLTELDISNNSALTSINCNNNQLTTLDVSRNPALKWFNCSDNQITTLDVSDNPALTSFNCSSNQLTTLDISSNPALENLYCSDNQLTTLNVSNNPALEWFGCYGNQLTELDISNNSALIALGCESNQLTELDVSRNTALLILICRNNQLTSLDISNNSALVILICDNNNMSSPNDVFGWEKYFVEPGTTNDAFCFYPQNPELTPTSTPTPTPIPDCKIEAFITRLYKNVLECDPDEEFVHWINGLKTPDESAASIIDEFFFGERFLTKAKTNEEFVGISYNTLMDREADHDGQVFWLKALNDGFNRRYVMDQILMSTEFTNMCVEYEIELGPVAGVEGFVMRMYRNVLEKRYDLAGLTYWSDGLKSGDETAASVINRFFFDEEFLAKVKTNEQFIRIVYNSLLYRDPDAEGLNYWLGVMQDGTNHRAVLSYVVESDEFMKICADYQITPGELIPVSVAVNETFIEFDITEDIEIMVEEIETVVIEIDEIEQNETEQVEAQLTHE